MFISSKLTPQLDWTRTRDLSDPQKKLDFGFSRLKFISEWKGLAESSGNSKFQCDAACKDVFFKILHEALE